MGRVALIENEFGNIGLDHDPVEEATKAMVLLQSGCLCFAVRDDLVMAMAALLRRHDAGDVAFDRVVIELTGLAEPGPILQTLMLIRRWRRRSAGMAQFLLPTSPSVPPSLTRSARRCRTWRWPT